ncbi:MAG TPA: hypothetical protein PKV93_13205 [Fervidobacterium sp.]|nr:hypothetical protein [Fervidobacterium sp.]
MAWERVVKEYACSPSKVAVLGATIERGRPVSKVRCSRGQKTRNLKKN